LELLQALQTTRAMLRAHNAAAGDTIEFAVPHSLAFTFFPAWLSGLRGICGPIKSRLTALNVHDAVLRLVEGHADLLIAFHHPSQPIQLDAQRYEMLPLGREVLAPCVKANAAGQAVFRLPGTPAYPVPYLAYAPGAYLGRVVEQALKASPVPVHLDRVYETDMAEGLKAMAREGHGVAFLPLSAVQKDLDSGKLVLAGEGLDMPMDIRIYRERPLPGSTGSPPNPAEVFWARLSERMPTDQRATAGG
jgi:DNA-binding transcriptional LysR family regulator